MTWHAQLDLRYSCKGVRSVVQHRHGGPLRVLKALYPEGAHVCHSVLVHPPGGIAGGDRLEITVDVEPGARALISTPGATRFYRSDSAPGVQNVRLRVAEQARLEWLPLETLVYPGAVAESRLLLEVAPGASLMAWDVVGLGLPHAAQPFDRGQLLQHISWPGVWLERARLDASDARLLDSPLGLAGHRCVATMFYASGNPFPRAARDDALELTRLIIDAHPLAAHAGATMPNDRLVLVRALAPVTEPVSSLFRQIWASWRRHFWQVSSQPPRIWSV